MYLHIILSSLKVNLRNEGNSMIHQIVNEIGKRNSEFSDSFNFTHVEMFLCFPASI